MFPTTGMTPPETDGDVFYVLVSARVLVRGSCQVRTSGERFPFLLISNPSGLGATRQSSLILIDRADP